MEDHKDHQIALIMAKGLRDRQNKTDNEIRVFLESNYPDYAAARKAAGLDVLPLSAGRTEPVEKEARSSYAKANNVRTFQRKTPNVTLSATYRFIPSTDGIVVKAPKSVQRECKNKGWHIHPLNDPMAEGSCAEIEIVWEAETPLLIGASKRDNVSPKPAKVMIDGVQSNGAVEHVVTARLNSQGEPEWIIPGSTLRGMVRHAVETISFSRLTQFNRNRFFSLREFQHRLYGRGTYPLLERSAVKCGWLRLSNGSPRDKTQPDKVELEILPMAANDWDTILADDLVKNTKYKNGAAFIVDKSFTERLKALGVQKNKRGAFDFFNAKPIHHSISGAGPARAMLPLLTYEVPKKQGRPAKQKNQHLIAMPSNHSDPEAWIVLSSDAAKRFIEVHSTRNDDKLKPKDHLGEYWKTLADGQAIPVFFVGTPPTGNEKAADKKFAMGLTRLFRVPHLFDFRSAVEAGFGPSVPEHDIETGKRIDKLDLGEAIFGYVYEADDLLPSTDPKKRVSIEKRIGGFSQKGRIAFSHARLDEETPAKELDPIVATMGQPQPSFAPYYLTGEWKDYSPPKDETGKQAQPKIAGRKTYLPRYDGSPTTKPEQALRRSARETIINNDDGRTPKADKYNTWSALTFLTPARENSQLRFHSRIKLHNVVPEEIGAVLWAITHGGNTKSHRHMVGHAKNLGAGQIRVADFRLNVVRNDGSVDAALQDEQAYMHAFENYMETHVSDWRRHKAIISWFKAARPETGAKLDAKGKLKSIQPVQEHSKIRELTAPLEKRDKHGNLQGVYKTPNSNPLISLDE